MFLSTLGARAARRPKWTAFFMDFCKAYKNKKSAKLLLTLNYSCGKMEYTVL